MNSPWFPEMLYDVLGRVKPGEMVYLAHALLHTHTHTHAFCYTPTAGVGREREEFGRKNVYVCKSSLEGGRGGLYEWWSWLGEKKELSSADLFRFKFPPNTYTQMLPCERESSWWPFNHYRLFFFFFFLFSLLHFPSYLSIYVLTSSFLYIYVYLRV